MTERSPERAMLIAIHSDILLPDEEWPRHEQEGDTLPATADRRFVLRGGRYTIGRSSRQCLIRAAKHRHDISRLHAIITREATGYFLEDHSTLGTFVNGQQVAGKTALHNGDVVGLANSREMLLFKLDGASASLHADQLTEREREILRLVREGQSNKEIAAELQIAPNTVKAHLKSIFEKLDVRNRTAAANAAWRRGLL